MLDLNSIYVWRLALGRSSSVSESQAARLRGWLSPEELARADAFRGEEYRRDYVLAHGALRRVLGQSTGNSPEAVRFVAGSFREAGATAIKPACDLGSDTGNLADGKGTDLRFNLSHTQGAALIGVTIGRELGIDIEWHRPMDDLEGMARAIMSEAELGSWGDIPEKDRLSAFYHVWTRKESYLKGIGLGLYHSLHDVTVPVSSATRDAISGDFEGVRDRSREDAWIVADLPAPEGYSASVCCEGEARPQIVVQELELERVLSE
jgi:4'-phosphopantetheinyl transferase